MAAMPGTQPAADPWASGFDPWAASAAVSASKPSAPLPSPPDPWQPFVKGGGKSIGCAIGTGCKGGKPLSLSKQSNAKGGGLSRGRGKTGQPIMQTQKIRDWHVDTGQQGPEEQVEEVKVSRGRGRSLIQPAWKTATGLNNPPDMLGTSTAVSSCAAKEPNKQLDPFEKRKHDYLWFCKLPNLSGYCPEAEVLKDCDSLGPGDWLSCKPGDQVLVVYSLQDLAYAMAYCHPERNAGWVPLAHLRLDHSGEHHEFIVRLVAHATIAKPLGLRFARSKGPIPGLVVCNVLPNSLLDDWNTRCCTTFPRDQVIAGDLVTWVNGSSELDFMRSTLLEVDKTKGLNPAPLTLRLRIIRNHSMFLNSKASQTFSEILAHRSHGEQTQIGWSSAETPQQSVSPDIPRAVGAATSRAAGPATVPSGVAAEVPRAVGAKPPAKGADPWAGGADPWAASLLQTYQ